MEELKDADVIVCTPQVSLLPRSRFRKWARADPPSSRYGSMDLITPTGISAGLVAPPDEAQTQ